MSLQRWDPFRDMFRLRDAMDRLLEESFVRMPGVPQAFGMPIDVEESDNDYTVTATLPGFRPEDVNVSIVGDTLTISAEKKSGDEQQGANYLLRERRTGSVSRTITFPARVQADAASARYENGELILTVPKAEEMRPRQVKVEIGSGKKELAGTTSSQS